MAVSLRRPSAAAPAAAPGTLFEMCFGACAGDGDALRIEVPLRPLGVEWLREVWTGPARISADPVAGVGAAASGEHLLVHASAALPVQADTGAATLAVYLRLLTRTRELGYPWLCRAWNFVPDINRGSGDAETYVDFSKGRALAFDQFGLPAARYPAATAVGSPAGSPLLVAFLASRTEPVAIENPRQTSAYRYPRQYGPRSPAFARAMVLPDAGGGLLFVSGTASIVGHESQHLGIEPQLDETLVNLEQLLAAAAATLPKAGFGPRRSWRVYLRHAHDQPAVADRIGCRLGDPDQVAYLQADICRRELLVEIEGACELTAAPTGRS